MMQFQTLTSQSYKQFRLDLLKKVEGNKDKPYLDSEDKKIPTIGIGFNLRVSGVADKIFEKFGINPDNANLSAESRAREKHYQDEIIRLLKNTYSNNDALQTALDGVMYNRSKDELLTAIADRRASFAFRNDDEVKVVFEAIIDTYEAKVNSRLAGIPESFERLALVSLAYNTKDGPTSLLGDKLKRAISDGDRAEAWFEIRYNSNGNDLTGIAGIAKRRYYEANIFGLWEGVTPTWPEIAEFGKMLLKHWRKITVYDERWGKVDPNDGVQSALELAISEFNLNEGNVTLKGIFLKIGINLETLVNYAGSFADALRYFGDQIANLVSCRLAVAANHEKFTTSTSLPPPALRGDPLILDLDGDGVETTHVKGGAYFDHDANGFAEQTGWAGSDDGLLVWDRNGDGIINNGRELFGDQTILKTGVRAANGFQALGEWDVNLDGKIDFMDSVWSNLRVWQDFDGDGFSSGDELFTLGNLGIMALNTGHTNTNITDSNGNIQTQAGTFRNTDGTTGQMGNFNMRRDMTYTIANQWLDVPAGISALPDLQAYGNVYDLHQAMVRDTSGQLRTLVQNFMASLDPTVCNGLMEQILFKWTGSDGINPTSRGTNIDARKLGVLEKFFGVAFVGVGGSNPNVNAAALLNQSYKGIFEMFYAGLMAQTHLKDFYGKITYTWDDATQSLKGDLANVKTELENRCGVDPILGETVAGEFIRGIKGFQAETMLGLDTLRSNRTFSWLMDSFGPSSQIDGSINDDTLSGTAASDGIRGGGGNDTISGGDGNDVLYGGPGDDYLDGGSGVDVLRGGAGNDTIRGTQYVDTHLFSVGDGQDVIQDNGAGDILRFGLGINPSDMKVERVGTDMVFKHVNGMDKVTVKGWYGTGYNQLGRVEFGDGSTFNLSDLQLGTTNADTLTGTSNDTVMMGDTGNDTLNGGAGNDLINGGAGADTMIGGLGNDSFVMDDIGDIVIEASNEGTDTVFSSITYTLPSNVENLTLTGTTAINGTGNALDNILTGNSGANILSGGPGNDTYIVDSLDTVIENANEGVDTIRTSETYTLPANVENLILTGVANLNGTGNSLNNNLTGNPGNNILNGGAGADTMAGGAGDDTYVVDNTGDTVIENPNEGNDTIQSSVTFTLPGNVENLILIGTGAINGTGNSLNNTLTGNSGANILTGGLGNDTYIVGSGDTVVENPNEGIDTVQSSITWTLGANIENLILTGTSAINGTGNDLNNILTGNSGANTLNGGLGADTMVGGAGNDTYIVDNPGDIITENLNEGTDTVQSSITFTLPSNVENLTLTGTNPINGTGNELNNSITGNSASNILTGGLGNDTLNGGAGADTLIGGLGNDTYVIDDPGDIVTESLNEGTDTVQSYITYTLGANLENLTLMGTLAINGTGNSLNNILTGNSAANVLAGGLGNDTYVIGPGDTVIENANEGTDTVQSSITYTLPSNIENLTLTGTSAIDGTGNELNNSMTGNSASNILIGGLGNDTLNGGAGADTLIGGLGNDTYVVDNIGDVVTEGLNEGTDTVQSSISYTLGENLENLTLTGTLAIDGTGNELSNIITGNSANNILTGGAGNDTLRGNAGADTLDGGTGNDTLEGGAGNDLYLFGKGYGQDKISENDTTAGNSDKVKFFDLNPIDLIFSNSGNNLNIQIYNSTDLLTVQNQNLSSAYQVETFESSDGKRLVSSYVGQLIQAMAGFSSQTGMNWTQLIENRPQDVQTILAQYWQQPQ